MRLLVFFFSIVGIWAADQPSPLEFGNLKFNVEFRTRLESRTGVNFGRDPNIDNPLFRTRLGAQWKPKKWLKLSGMLQDSRAPFYGRPAPATARDSVDLHEGYVELFPDAKEGFGLVAGRQMVTYGEGRLIGVPQWGNISRTFDTARVYYRLPQVRLEFLLVSIIKIQPDAFNKPVLGDRLWGAYNSFPKLIPKGVAEVYVLRHDQNRPGGFTEPGTLGVTTFGGRATGPLVSGFKYSLEGAVQTGHVSTRTHRAAAWFSNVSRRVALHFPIDLSGEYKYASGSDDPSSTRNGTFEQLYATNHDKFGHADLFGWRNIHNLRSLNTIRVTKELALNLMYNNWWLASARDALYNGQGRSIVQRRQGDAGMHVGQEFDVYSTYVHGWFQVGAGFAHVFKGEFLRKTTPGVNTRYVYLFQQFTW